MGKDMKTVFQLISLLLTIICSFVGVSQNGMAEAQHISVGDFYTIFEKEKTKEESAFFNAELIGPYYSGYNWWYGIVSKEKNYYVYMVLSGDEPDASILSGRIMVKRSDKASKGGYLSKVLFDELQSIFAEILQQYDLQFHYKYVGECYSGLFSTDQFVISSSEIINEVGDICRSEHYYPYPNGNTTFTFELTLQELLDQYLPEIDPASIEQYIEEPWVIYLYDDWNEMSPERQKITYDWNKQFQPYLFPYHNGIYIEVPRSETFSHITFLAKQNTGSALFRSYLESFQLFTNLDISSIVDLLLYQYGEEFAWSHYIKPNEVLFRNRHILYYSPDFEWYLTIESQRVIPALVIRAASGMKKIIIENYY